MATGDINLNSIRKSTAKRPIKAKKVQDIVKQLPYVPRIYRAFYEEIKAKEGPFSDVDSDIETDNL